MFQCSENPDGIECQSSSAIELVVGCFARIVTGDWTNISEDILVSSVVVLVFLISWYVTFCMLKISSLWERAKEQSTQYQHQLNTLSDGQENAVESSRQQIEQDTAQDNAERMLPDQSDTPPSGGDADFRAAGDGWEADEDVDYLVDEDLIMQGNVGYSDEDSDDDVVVLRRIILAADAGTPPSPVEDTNEQEQIDTTGPLLSEQDLVETAQNVLSNIVDFIDGSANENEAQQENDPGVGISNLSNEQVQVNNESNDQQELLEPIPVKDDEKLE